MVYVQQRDLKSAERAIETSLDTEKQGGKVDPRQAILVADTLSHMEYQRGRISEATANTRELLNKYGTDDKIPNPLRAHLYEDYATLCMQQNNISEAVKYFTVSVGLQREAPVQSTLARTLALLARAQIAANQLDDARQTVTEAVAKEGLVHENPIDDAVVSESYGEYLIARRRWDEARTAFKTTLSYGSTSPAFANVHIEALQQLAEADHHLHLKKEEKSSRKEARMLEAGLQFPGANAVVDIATLKNSYVADRH
jgi:tetratricopeptide (TPR) repeat protein